MPSAAQWSKRVEEWRCSGQTAAVYAGARGWNPRTLVWWGSRVNRARGAAAAVQLLPVVAEQGGRIAAPADEVECVLRVQTARGCAVEVRRGFDPDLLRDIVRALEVG